MKLGKKDKINIANASAQKLRAMELAIERQLVRRKYTYHKDTGAKMGAVIYDVYHKLLVKKIKIVKDDKNVLYQKFSKKVGMWSGNKYVMRNKLRLDYTNPWQSFLLDYANRKKIKKLKPEVHKIEQWYGQRK